MKRIKPQNHEEIELDPRRTFTRAQKAKLFMRSQGKCDLCAEKITGPWIAGHIIAWTLGGRTETENGRVECTKCSKTTHNRDTKAAAKAERMAGRKGQSARRKKNGSKFPSMTKKQRKERYQARKTWAEKARKE